MRSRISYLPSPKREKFSSFFIRRPESPFSVHRWAIAKRCSLSKSEHIGPSLAKMWGQPPKTEKDNVLNS